MHDLRFITALRTSLLLLPVILFCSAPGLAEERRTLNLRLGGSDTIETSHPVSRITIAGPKIADVNVLSPHYVYVYGKETGYTSMILWEEGEGKTLLDVVVSLDLTSLKEKLHQLYPDENIKVHGSETGIVLSGTVSGPEVMEQVIRLTESFFPKSGGGNKGSQGTGRSGRGITNLLKVAGNKQVMLEVKFAELNRNSNKEWQGAMGLGKLGSDFNAAAGVGNVMDKFSESVAGNGVTTPYFSGSDMSPGSLLLNFEDNPANIFLSIDNFSAALNFLESEGLARILAEPRLVTQSGQEASFLAGGEFPIPVPQDNDSITVDFKEFGVALSFTPVLMSDGRINLQVAPSVSEISSTSRIPAGIEGTDFVVPNLSTRKLDTNVQLHDGQTLALAGLLQDNLRETVNKVPGLGDIPILGSLFRSSSFQQNKTDLLITVTPHIVKPVKEGSIDYPGEHLNVPNRYEFYLEGRLEGRSDSDSAMSRHSFSRGEDRSGGLEGEYGHQPLKEGQETEDKENE
ncbi:MAG: type II and III secretion system protein family protein [Desulfurivibrionaceae bacterium]